jgi:hypothetical protein
VREDDEGEGVVQGCLAFAAERRSRLLRISERVFLAHLGDVLLRRRRKLERETGVALDWETDAATDEPEEELDEPSILAQKSSISVGSLLAFLDPELALTGSGTVGVGGVVEGEEDGVELQSGFTGGLEEGGREGRRGDGNG